MVEQTPPPVSGQILAPSALELAWDRHRKTITTGLILLAIALLGYYGTKFYRRSVQDREWLGFSRATDLRRGVIEGVDIPRTRDEQFFRFWRDDSQRQLAAGLPKAIADVDVDELRKQIDVARGTPQQPYLLWVLANHLRFKGDVPGATAAVEQIARDFPQHPLCRQVAWPPSYVPPAEESKDPQARPKVPSQGPPAASITGLFLSSVAQDKAIRESHRGLFEAPEPDATPTVAIKLKLGDEEKAIRIRLYKEAAPRHVQNFLDKIKNGHFNQLNVHQLRRQGTGNQGFFAQENASWFALGNPKSKDVNREKWTPEDPPKEPLPIEENTLSPMEGMVVAPAAYSADGRRSNPDIIQFMATDASADNEFASLVVFGRVIEGMETVKRIAQEPFASQREMEQGRGAPQRLITVVSASIEN